MTCTGGKCWKKKNYAHCTWGVNSYDMHTVSDEQVVNVFYAYVVEHDNKYSKRG